MDLWLGLLFSIPISIIINLITPRIQLWLDKSSKQRSLERIKYLKDEYNEAKKFKENPHLFTQFLIYTGLRVTFIGSFIGIIVSIPVMTTYILDALLFPLNNSSGGFRIRYMFYLASQFTSIIGALLIINLCRRAISLWNKINDFDVFEKSIEETLKENPQSTSTN